jgi:hypothetical protein
VNTEQWRNDTDRGKLKYSKKILSHATLSITNPTWTDMGTDPSFCREKLSTIQLSYGTAIFGPKRDELMGGLRKLHDDLHNLYFQHWDDKIEGLCDGWGM